MRTMVLLATAAAFLPAAGPDATLLGENFDGAQGGNIGTGQQVGQFAVTKNDVDLIGVPSSLDACGAPANGCLDLDGNANGAITSGLLATVIGQTCAINFDLPVTNAQLRRGRDRREHQPELPFHRRDRPVLLRPGARLHFDRRPDAVGAAPQPASRAMRVGGFGLGSSAMRRRPARAMAAAA